jgi:protein phosphatase
MDIQTGSFILPGCKLQYAAATNQGLVRKHNEDNLLVLANLPVFCVADGAGGHSDGGLASQLTLQKVKFFFSPHAPLNADDTVPLPEETMSLPSYQGSATETLIESAIIYANTVVHNEAQGQQMASTIVACHFEETKLHIAHVGDSRVYLFQDNELQQLTEDHSLVNMLYKQGEITKDEMRTHPKRNVITRAVGIEANVEVSVSSTGYQAGGCYLLCSDGLTSMVMDTEICNIMEQDKDSLTNTCNALIEKANSYGGKDNITVILIKVI